VTAHGSPGGPLQFDRLEAALAARFSTAIDQVHRDEQIALQDAQNALRLLRKECEERRANSDRNK
jgi:hypothetical protein